MYAVIETGGKQYRVELGSEFAVERLDGVPGDTIEFERVLLVADEGEASIGTPLVSDALVRASLVRHDRAGKVIVFKYRPKARHRAKKGHRQEQTVIRVADIRFNGRSAADEASTQQKEEAQARRRAEAEAERKAATDKALAAKLEKEAAERAAAAPEAGTAAAKKPRRTSKVAQEAAAQPGEAKPGAKATARTKSAAKPASKPAAKSTTAKTSTTEETKPARTRQARPKKEE